MQGNSGKKQSGKDQISLQENWRYQGNISYKDGYDKGQKQSQQNQKSLRRDGKNTQKNFTKVVLMNWISTMVWSLPQSQTSQSVKSSEKRKKKKLPLGGFTMNKARGGDGIPAELFKILKEYAVKVLHSVPQDLKS